MHFTADGFCHYVIRPDGKPVREVAIRVHIRVDGERVTLAVSDVKSDDWRRIDTRSGARGAEFVEMLTSQLGLDLEHAPEHAGHYR